jgi:hypothetical protein
VSNPTIEWRLPDRNVSDLQMPPVSGASAPAFSLPGAMLSGFFAAILGSLHRSRRRQARRIAREYRHLRAAEARREVDVAIAKRRS